MITHHPERLLDSNSIQINFDSFGDPHNPVILLIMGLATQMVFWDPGFCQSLAAQGYWVIRMDNRDSGKSSGLATAVTPTRWALIAYALFKKPIPPAYSLSDMADDTLGLMDGLGIKRAHLVGASMGGMIAQLMAIRAPQRVGSLTSIMSTTGNRSLPKPSLKFSLKLLSIPLKDLSGYVPHALKLWRILHGTHFQFQGEKVQALLELSQQRGINLSGSTRQLVAILNSPDRTLDLQSLRVPSLVIHGDSDPLVPLACGQATAAAIPEAKLKVYVGMGHTFPSELYPAISEDILELVASVERSEAHPT
jgi:pimeloyl-ACP methyl ester carboxylesterase